MSHLVSGHFLFGSLLCTVPRGNLVFTITVCYFKQKIKCLLRVVPPLTLIWSFPLWEQGRQFLTCVWKLGCSWWLAVLTCLPEPAGWPIYLEGLCGSWGEAKWTSLRGSTGQAFWSGKSRNRAPASTLHGWDFCALPHWSVHLQTDPRSSRMLQDWS